MNYGGKKRAPAASRRRLIFTPQPPPPPAPPPAPAPPPLHVPENDAHCYHARNCQLAFSRSLHNRQESEGGPARQIVLVCPYEKKNLATTSDKTGAVDVPTQPPMVACKNAYPVGICARFMRVFFCMFGTDLYAQPVIINKISASELRRKFNKSAFIVGWTTRQQLW